MTWGMGMSISSHTPHVQIVCATPGPHPSSECDQRVGRAPGQKLSTDKNKLTTKTTKLKKLKSTVKVLPPVPALYFMPASLTCSPWAGVASFDSQSGPGRQGTSLTEDKIEAWRMEATGQGPSASTVTSRWSQVEGDLGYAHHCVCTSTF